MSRRRKLLKRQQTPVLLILTEDTDGVAEYLQHRLRSRQGDKVSVNVEGQGKPPTQLLKLAKRALRGGSRSVPPADFVFIVFDRDQHNDFNQTIAETHDCAGILPIVCIPCFEQFFLMHYSNSTAPNENNEAVLAKLKAYDDFKDYEKKRGSVPIVALSEREQFAMDNCKLARQHRTDTGTENPYSDIDLLFSLCDIARRDGVAGLHGLDRSDFFR